jgi:FKBP-type peptidyl-prolyl cis-trans isomerase FklB
MNSLRSLWRETTARLRKPFSHRARSSTADSMPADGEQGNTVVQLERVRDRFATSPRTEASRIASLEQRLALLETEHAATERQLHVVEKELAVTGSDLEKTTIQVQTLARELEEGQQLYLQTVQETQLQMRKQDMRLNWLRLISVFALLLAAVACAILIWDVQKNAGLLAGMSSDIKQLMITLEQQGSLSQPAAQDMQTDMPVAPHTKLPPLPDQSSTPSPEPLPPVPDFLPAPDAVTPDEAPAGSDDAASADEVKQFFARNASMPDMVSLPSGVQYRVVRQGDGKSPGMNDWVVVDYLGMTPDGSIFDNTYDSGQRAIFGMNGLLPGWQEPLLRMQEGSEFEVYVPPEIANIGGITSLSKQAGEPGIYLIELIQVVAVDGEQ